MEKEKFKSMIEIFADGHFGLICIPYDYYDDEDDCHILKTMQNAVGGRIETISDDRYVMIVNEEGKLEGLPVNERATAIAHERKMIKETDHICGNALIALHGEDDIELFDRKGYERAERELFGEEEG